LSLISLICLKFGKPGIKTQAIYL